MITLFLILIIIFLVGLGCGVGIWFVFQHRQVVKSKEPIKETTTAEPLTFRWRYIMLPAAVLLLSMLLTAYFYHQLPPEIAYRFKLDGTPDKWLSREMAMVWMLAPQFFLTIVAGGITWGITKLDILSRQVESAWIEPERILLLMGNIIALPQLVICFTMLDIFSYNSYQIHIMPIWMFALIIMAVGGVILGIFFILAIRRAWRTIR